MIVYTTYYYVNYFFSLPLRRGEYLIFTFARQHTERLSCNKTAYFIFRMTALL